jgi:Rapamycin-insensitive companion of mTOR, N-term
MSLASKAIVNIMRNWNGVIYFASSPLGLSSLISSLNQPIRNYKKAAILDTFIDIFNVPMFIGGNEVGSVGGTGICFSGSAAMSSNENLLNNYVALLL